MTWNLLENLKLDSWEKILIVMGVIGFFISLTIPVQGVSNFQLTILSLGLVSLGLGEWKNIKYLQEFVPQSAFNPGMWITVPIRKPDAVGTLFVLLGVIAIVVTMVSMFGVVAII